MQATASVDSSTDSKIQVTVRTEFKSCTVLTIAHRLETIADSDLIFVMNDGQLAEQGPPGELLEVEGGLFRALVDELGPERKAVMIEKAMNKDKYDLDSFMRGAL